MAARHVGDGAVEAADGVVVLHGDHRAGLLGILQHQLLIEGLDGEHVDDGGVDALLLEQVGGLDGAAHHEAGGDDGHVRALAEHHALADLELLAVGVDAVVGLAVDAQILHALAVHQVLEDGRQLGGVRRVNDGGAGDGAVEGHILKGHVGAAVHGGGDAGVGADHGDAVVGIGAGQEHLIVAAAGGEGAEGVADGLEARRGQAAGDAHHVGLGDAAVDGAVRMGLAVLGGADAAHQVGVQIDVIRVLIQQLRDVGGQKFLEGAAVRAAVIDHLHAQTTSFSMASRSALTAAM